MTDIRGGERRRHRFCEWTGRGRLLSIRPSGAPGGPDLQSVGCQGVELVDQHMLVSMCQPASAASNKVRITNLTDVSFGPSRISLPMRFVRLKASASTPIRTPAATTSPRSGSGPAGAFQLSSGLSSLAYEVQWSSSAGQASVTVVLHLPCPPASWECRSRQEPAPHPSRSLRPAAAPALQEATAAP